jgi:hypothetical protein
MRRASTAVAALLCVLAALPYAADAWWPRMHVFSAKPCESLLRAAKYGSTRSVREALAQGAQAHTCADKVRRARFCVACCPTA